MILLLSDSADVHADLLAEKLRLQSLACYRLNLDVESLQVTTVTYRAEGWSIAQRSDAVNSSQFTAVWARRGFVEAPLGMTTAADADSRIFKSEWNKTLVGLYSSLSAVPWLNWISHSIRAENKYLQMRVASSVGL